MTSYHYFHILSHQSHQMSLFLHHYQPIPINTPTGLVGSPNILLLNLTDKQFLAIHSTNIEGYLRRLRTAIVKKDYRYLSTSTRAFITQLESTASTLHWIPYIPAYLAQLKSNGYTQRRRGKLG